MSDRQSAIQHTLFFSTDELVHGNLLSNKKERRASDEERGEKPEVSAFNGRTKSAP